MMMPSKLSKEAKEQMLVKLHEYYELEREEELSALAAELLIDFIIKEFGPYFYNQGIDDAKQMLEEKFLSMEEDLYALKKVIKARV